MITRTTDELVRLGDIYDALTGDPGPQDLDTLERWLVIVRATEDTLGPVPARIERLTAHIGSKVVADQCRRMSADG